MTVHDATMETRPSDKLTTVRRRNNVSIEMCREFSLCPSGKPVFLSFAQTSRYVSSDGNKSFPGTVEFHGQILNGFQIQFSGSQQRNIVNFPKTIGGRNPEIRQSR